MLREAPRILACLSVGGALFAALAPTAAARIQATEVSITPVLGSSVAFHRMRVAPLGGAVAAFAVDYVRNATGVFANETIRVVRFSDRGDPIQSIDLDVSDTSLPGVVLDLAPGPLGETAVLSGQSSTVLDAPEQIHFLAPDGSLRWVQRFDRPTGGHEPQPLRLEFDASGNLLVIGFLADTTPGAPDLLEVRSLAAADGSVQWTYQRPAADVSAPEFFLDVAPSDVVPSGGDLFVTWEGPSGREVARLDALGGEVYRTPIGLSGPIFGFAVDDAQNVFATTGPVHAGIDASGQLLWVEPTPTPAFGFKAGALGGGEFALIHGCCWVSRINSLGQTAWTHLSNGINHSYDQVLAVPGDLIVLRGLSPNSTSPDIEWLDAGGTEVARAEPPGIASASQTPGPFQIDARGNAWYSTVEAPTGGPTYSDRGYALKLALGGDQGTTACTQPFPNSTGLFGSLGAHGSPIAARDNLTLIAEDLPPDAFTLFLNSRTQGHVPGLAGSQATLCLGGQINRYAGPGELRQASPAGRATLQLDLATTPMGPLFLPIVAGETWYFQAWHRDPAGPGALHLTDSISVVFS